MCLYVVYTEMYRILLLTLSFFVDHWLKCTFNFQPEPDFLFISFTTRYISIYILGYILTFTYTDKYIVILLMLWVITFYD